MAKRASRQAVASAKIRPLFPDGGGWTPLGPDDRRDVSYVRNVRPMGPNQKALMEAIDARNLVVAVGPAGTGKTYLAIAKAVEAFGAGRVGRILLSRPAVEAGESLGYLPGDLHEKLAPYLRPLYDALSDRLGGKQLKALLADGSIEIAPVAYMRGRTLNNAFIVIDEAQNCTYTQIKMLLTRLGWHSTMVLTGYLVSLSISQLRAHVAAVARTPGRLTGTFSGQPVNSGTGGTSSVAVIGQVSKSYQQVGGGCVRLWETLKSGITILKPCYAKKYLSTVYQGVAASTMANEAFAAAA